MPEFDVFISHANKDKENLIEELYQSLNKLGIKIFYDKESLEWGDNWKDRILNGTKKAEFAIIVISENFFDREWTERELNEFLNRQNRNGQKLNSSDFAQHYGFTVTRKVSIYSGYTSD